MKKIIYIKIQNDKAIIVTGKKNANARILELLQDGSFTAHWLDNYNEDGDFVTELMRFNSDMTLNTDDLSVRQEIRAALGIPQVTK